MRTTRKDGVKTCRDISCTLPVILNCVARLFETFNRSYNFTALKEEIL